MNHYGEIFIYISTIEKELASYYQHVLSILIEQKNNITYMYDVHKIRYMMLHDT